MNRPDDVGPIISIQQTDHYTQECNANCYLNGARPNPCCCENVNKLKGLTLALQNNQNRLGGFIKQATKEAKADPCFCATIQLPWGYITIAATSTPRTLPQPPRPN